MTRRSCRLVSLLAAAGLAAASVLGLATAAVAAPEPGTIRLAVLSPDAGPLDIYIDGTAVLTEAPFSTVAPYRTIAPGPHTVSVRAPGTPTVLTSAPVTIAESGAYTAFFIGAVADMSTRIVRDNVETPAAGSAAVRVLHAGVGVPAVDIREVTTDTTLFADVAYDTPTAYGNVPGGSYDITMSRAGTSQVLWTVRGVAVKAGSAYTLAAVGGAGRALQILPLIDGSSDAVTPIGGIATGLGGGLRGPMGATVVAAGLAGLAVLCVLGGAMAWRRGH